MKTVLRFIACSDLHFKEEVATEPERFEKGMRLAYAYADAQEYPGIDALYINGDFANRGSEGEMRLMKRYADACVRPETQIAYTMASHEYFSPDKEEGAHIRFREIFQQEPDLHRVINGYHFISVTTEKGCRLFDEKKAWISRELKNAVQDDPTRPIFFFQHPHLTDTVYGSIAWGEDDIIPILMDYPQIVDFLGHSHAPINDPRSIHQRYFPSVGTGSLSYFELDEFDLLDGTVPKDKEFCAQFLIVEVHDDNSVLIKPFDILSGCFFHEGWFVEKPWDPSTFIYTDKRFKTADAPVFAPETAVDFKAEDGKLFVTFDQALSVPERPDSYTLVIRAADGHIVKQATVPSSYYIYEMPSRITAALEFDFSGSFTLELTANSFWKTHSAPLKTAFEV